MFNIADFRSQIDLSGVIRKSNFTCYVLPKKTPMDSAIERSFMYRCQSMDLPGYSLTTSDKKVYGPTTKTPYDTLYSDFTMNILLSEDLREKTYFEKWRERITGNHSDPTKSPNVNMFDIGYYDDYVADINIKMYSDTGKETFSTTAYSAYPIAIGNIAVDFNAGNELLILPVNISFGYVLRK